jgi:hypothetical protein
MPSPEANPSKRQLRDRRFGQRSHVSKAQIEPLSRERMHQMRRVADQR